MFLTILCKVDILQQCYLAKLCFWFNSLQGGHWTYPNIVWLKYTLLTILFKVDISPRKPTSWELRVIIWNTDEVISVLTIYKILDHHHHYQHHHNQHQQRHLYQHPDMNIVRWFLKTTPSSVERRWATSMSKAGSKYHLTCIIYFA